MISAATSRMTVRLPASSRHAPRPLRSEQTTTADRHLVGLVWGLFAPATPFPRLALEYHTGASCVGTVSNQPRIRRPVILPARVGIVVLVPRARGLVRVQRILQTPNLLGVVEAADQVLQHPGCLF